MLDIGGGIGVVDHELLKEGAARAVLVDASAPSLDAAREEGRRRGDLDRLETVHGDFVTQASADRARGHRHPRSRRVLLPGHGVAGAAVGDAGARRVRARPAADRAIIRWGLRLMNVWFRVRGMTYRAFAHPNDRIDAIVEEAGLRARSEARTFFWRVVLYERQPRPILSENVTFGR